MVSHEHTAHRWMDPSDYRERYVSAAVLSSINDAHLGQLVTDMRDDLDRHLQWKDFAQPEQQAG